MQYSINWDCDVLEFVNVIPSGDVPNLGTSSFGSPPALACGNATLVWFATPDNPAVTLPDSTVMFQICYNIIGPCESESLVEFSGNPTPVEITNTIEDGFQISTEFHPGSVIASDCDPTGLQFIADCGSPVNINDQFCVEVSVGDDFQAVTSFSYLLEWNPNILTFDEVTVTGALAGLLPGDFNLANPNNGVLEVVWDPTAIGNQTLAPNTAIYNVCFTAEGIGGDSPFSFVTQGASAIVNNGSNIGINPSNCEVAIIQPDGVAMTIGNGSAPPGETTCVDVTVSNFENVLSYQFSLLWDPSLIEFVEVTNINLPEANIPDNFGLGGASSGSLFFDWQPSTDYTLTDGTSIFQLCYTPAAGAPPDICSDIEVVDLPIEAEAITTESNGDNVGIISQVGEFCVLFPEGFSIDIGEVAGDRLDTICVPVTVASFDNIISAAFSMNFDPTLLEYVGINIPGTWPGLTETGNFDFSNTSVGIINLDWTDLSGAAIPDDEVVFELCFALLDFPYECSPVTVSESDPIVVETQNGMGSLVIMDGEVCINDRFIIEEVTITPASCAEVCDGGIEISVSGGTAPVGTSWSWIENGTQQNQFTQFFVNGVCAGEVCVTIFDNANPALILKDTFFIEVSEDLIFADAGPDSTVLGCDPAAVLLTGDGPIGVEYSYNWTSCSGENTDGTTLVATLVNCYIFTVTNDTTGCVARDTIIVTEPSLPGASAGPDMVYTCDMDTVTLNGMGTSDEGTITYTWSAITDTVSIVAGEENLQNPGATGPGFYQVEIGILETGCSARDTVEVFDGRIFPSADGGPDREVSCSDGTILLEGSTAGNESLSVTYEWFDENGPLSPPGISVMVTDPGTYTLVVTEFSTGCSSSDEVMLIPNNDLPQVDAGDTLTITCLVDTVMLMGMVDPDTIDFDFSWNVLEGDPFVANTENTLSPKATGAGIYELFVTNTDNGCSAADTVVVVVDTIAPIAVAGDDFTLTCGMQMHQLDGTGSSTGDNIAYCWVKDGVDTISMILNPIIEEPGEYCLIVKDTINGCTAIDCVTIDIDGIPPLPMVDEMQTLTCENDTLTLTAVIDPPSTEYIYEWVIFTPPGTGNIVPGTENMLEAQVTEVGTYQIRVTNPENNCVGVNEIVVNADTDEPEIAIADPNPITCIEETSILDGTGSSAGNDFIYEWLPIDHSNVPAINDALVTEVDTAGMYQLTVMDTTNGCFAIMNITVDENKEEPQFNIIEPTDQITCANDNVSLDASGTIPVDATILWTGLDGGTADPVDAVLTTVYEGGQYELFIIDNLNGCENRDTVSVDADTTAPEAVLLEPDSVTCISTEVGIDATQSTINGDFMAEWTALGVDNTIAQGADPLTATATGAGLVQVIITQDINGCSDTLEVEVFSDTNLPTADAGTDPGIPCGGTAEIGSSNTSQGNEFTYVWTAIEGNLSGAVDGLTASVDIAGTYELSVTDNGNGCSATSTVMVSLDMSGLPTAEAGEGISECGDTTMLFAEGVTGEITGIWTTSTGATIEMPNEASTLVNGLQPGENLFFWTLSADGCPDFSSDSVAVTLEFAPNATDDPVTIAENENSTTISLPTNDALGGIENWTLTILTQPSLGTIDTLDNGIATYTINPGLTGGTDEFTYEICNDACPDLCAQATAIITISEREAEEIEVANTITPNGDGMNDELVFDVLENNPEKFEENELIIFNRWGDVIYEAQPYLNDWRGTNKNGDQLPHGTYYYILRLSIPNGEIIRGDITLIMK